MYDIELINISKTYPGNKEPSVKDVSMQIPKGTIVTLLGPSGCGKTTTLRLIAGFERQEQGTIYLADKIVAGDGTWIPPERRGVGMVFQDYALFPHLNVEDNISFGLKKGPIRMKRVSELIALVGLEGLGKRYPHQISGGQQQRVALARALAPNPVVVLLDEPFSNLDTKLRKFMRHEVREIIKAESTTAIFVTHDQKDALSISEQIIVMNEGRIEQIGAPEEIYHRPATEFVAAFIGHSNIMEGTVSADRTSIETMIGVISCFQKNNWPPGKRVRLSLMPEGFRLDNQGNLHGRLRKLKFAGSFNEATIEVKTIFGEVVGMLFHVPSMEKLNSGAEFSFSIDPDHIIVWG